MITEKPTLIDSEAEMPTRAKEVQYAWAAGFIDGDGFISIERSRESLTAKIEATQAIEDPLLILRDLFGGTLTVKTNKYGKYLCWRVRGDNAEMALKAMLPYLVNKRRQAEIVIEFKNTIKSKRSGNGVYYERVTKEVKDQRLELYNEVKALNARKFHAERLSERAPKSMGGAIVRPTENEESVEADGNSQPPS